MTLFVDLDGTLADLDAHYEDLFGIRPSKALDNLDWDRVRDSRDFYLGIPPMADMGELWAFVRPHRPIILTGVPYSVEEAAANKRAWVAHHLGPGVEVRCCRSRDKALHARPGDVLVDDWEKYRLLWEAAGGRWVTHTSAAATIAALREIGF